MNWTKEELGKNEIISWSPEGGQQGTGHSGDGPSPASPLSRKTLTKFEILLKLVGPRMIMNVGCDA